MSYNKQSIEIYYSSGNDPSRGNKFKFANKIETFYQDRHGEMNRTDSRQPQLLFYFLYKLC